MNRPVPVPPPPPAPAQGIRAVFALRQASRSWPGAARAGVCMGGPLLAGWLAGDMPAGMMATLGAFTTLYGSGRPYLNRARHLALVAVAFALAVTVGTSAAAVPWLGVLVVVLVAMTATFLCNALQIAPPGAYIFALVCAAGTILPADHLGPWHTALVVLGGGAFAWAVHMVSGLWRPRGPEKVAVAAAAAAVANYAEAVGTARQNPAMHQAALALHASWETLVTFQPAHAHPDSTLDRLRALARVVHLLFADITSMAGRGEVSGPAQADLARRIGRLARKPPGTGAQRAGTDVPLGRPGAVQSVREALRPGTMPRLVTARVGIAALVAGGIGLTLGLERAYWAVAAAVLVLHQGTDWLRTMQKGTQRFVGTWVGLGGWCRTVFCVVSLLKRPDFKTV